MKSTLRLFQWVFLLSGAAALGYFLFAIFDSRIYQADQETTFEELRSSSGRPGGEKQKIDPRLVGRLVVPRLQLSVMVRDGIDDNTLRRAAGRIPGTARPGQAGNLGIAGHRDSFFRGLQNVRKNDMIRLTTLDAAYEYLNWYLSGWQGGFIAKQGYYSSVPETAREFLTEDEWGYWYEGKPAEEDILDPYGNHMENKGHVRDGDDLQLAQQLHEKAHHLCFIANSVNFPVACEPQAAYATR